MSPPVQPQRYRPENPFAPVPDFADVRGGASSAGEAPVDVEAIRERARDQSLVDQGTSMIQGATYNYGDELGLTNKEDVDRIAREHPWANSANEVVGGVLNPVSRLGMGGGRLLRLLSGSAQGAVAGSGADEENRGRGAVVGGALGLGATYGLEKAAQILAKIRGIPIRPPEPQFPKGLGDVLPPEPPVPAAPRAAPKSPSELVDALGPEFQTARGTGGAPVPPPPSVRSPEELVAAVEGRGPISSPKVDPYAIAAKTGAKVVPAGPYQTAAPATRMSSGPEPGLLAQRMANDPKAIEAQLELMRALGQTEPNPVMIEQLAQLLAQRSVP